MNSSKNEVSPILSIIIVNYNTKELLQDCLDSLVLVRNELKFEVIVVDNDSKDGSYNIVQDKYKWVKLIKSKTNLGFSAGNNLARNKARGKYVLFLNSDTVVPSNTLKESVDYMESNPDVGAMTCRIRLPNGDDDRDARRSFPTPWVALTHFCMLDRLFPKSRLFAKYWYGFIPPSKVQEVDVLQGAYFMSPRKILDEVNWFNEDYFLNGEDIDLSWEIKNKGLKIVYYPKVSIIHVKKGTKKTNKSMHFEMSGVKAMEIFYRKRMWDKYPLILNLIVIGGIRYMAFVRRVIHFIK